LFNRLKKNIKKIDDVCWWNFLIQHLSTSIQTTRNLGTQNNECRITNIERRNQNSQPPNRFSNIIEIINQWPYPRFPSSGILRIAFFQRL
jgi:hypothetical protein